MAGLYVSNQKYIELKSKKIENGGDAFVSIPSLWHLICR